MLGLCVLSFGISQAQDLLGFIESCERCNGNVKRIKTTQKVATTDSWTSTVETYLEFNLDKQLTKREEYINNRIQETVHYFYIDSLLIYEQHVQPDQEDYFLVYQYLNKKIPTKIIKVDKKRKIIDYAMIQYTTEYEPIFLKTYNLLDELQEKRSVEYLGNNYVVIQRFFPKIKVSQMNRHELLCKYNSPDDLKKRDFKDPITKPIKIEYKDKVVTVVKSVMVDKKEKIQIEEVTYDDFGNWLSKKTFDLVKKKTKKKLINEVKREIDYY